MMIRADYVQRLEMDAPCEPVGEANGPAGTWPNLLALDPVTVLEVSLAQVDSIEISLRQCGYLVQIGLHSEAG